MNKIHTTLFLIMRHMAIGAGICAITLFVAAPFSCKLSEEGIAVVSVDKTAPQILSFDVKQRAVLELVCTEAMSLKEVTFRHADDETASGNVAISYDETRTIASITLDAPTEIGERYALDGIMEDMNGNSLTFSLPFVGYNDKVARVIFSEVLTDGSKSTPEFVELYVLKSGNLAGLEIASGADGKAANYVFPVVEVNAGDYITVHYRRDTDTPDFCIDELDDDLTKATATSSNHHCDTARDLFADNEVAARLPNTDVLLLTCDNGTRVMDALLYVEGDKSDWTQALQKEYAEKAVASGIWPSAAITDAVNNTKKTATRSLSRQNISALAEQDIGIYDVVPVSEGDWFLVDTSCKTPGLPNSDKPVTIK